MTLRTLFRRAAGEAERPRTLMLACAIGIIFSVVFPTDLRSYAATPPDHGALVEGTDHYLRFVNTALQVAMPLLERDPVGAAQLVYVGLSTTAATQGLKFLFDRQTMWGVRLGQRPSGPGSRHNMPSGHSSMASCAVYFLSRRYGWWHLLYALPILFLTMYARVELNAHTVAAVVAGALLGLLMAMLFTGRRRVAPAPKPVARIEPRLA